MQREGSPFTPAEGHAQTEADLMQSGLAATILRNGQYMENLSLFLHLGLDGHRIALPADGPTAWVALHDLAEGIACALTRGEGDSAEQAQTLTLTGPEALDFSRIAEIASRLLGRPIRRDVIGSDKFIERAVQKGIGPHLARMFESGFQSRAAGELAKVDPALGTILGRPLGTVENELPRLLASLR